MTNNTYIYITLRYVNLWLHQCFLILIFILRVFLYRFLNKALLKTSSKSSWMLCSVTQVEETKLILRMIPILIATFIPSTMLAQINTLFVKQGTTLNRKIGNFNIPLASLTGFVTLSMLIFFVLYDRYFVKIIQKWTKDPRGITILQRMGIGMVLHIIIMIVALLTERYGIHVAKNYGLEKKSVTSFYLCYSSSIYTYGISRCIFRSGQN